MTTSFDLDFKTIPNDGVTLSLTVFPAPPVPVLGSRGTDGGSIKENSEGRTAHAAAPPPAADAAAPVLIFYHSGGLTGGSRLGFLPHWLIRYSHARGIHFVTTDYRLIPSTDIRGLEEDVVDAHRFVVDQLGAVLRQRGYAGIDTSKVVVTGASAGVFAALLVTHHLLRSSASTSSCFTTACATPSSHLSPPIAFLGLYGETNIASSFYNQAPDPTSSPPRPPTERSLKDLSYLFHPGRPSVTGTDVKWFSETWDDARMTDEEKQEYDQTNLTRTMVREGVTADILLGQDGLSQRLRAHYPRIDVDIGAQRSVIPEDLHPYFPLLPINHDFPRTLLFHGEQDVAIPIQDSEVFAKQLEENRVRHRFVRIRGQASVHGFDRHGLDQWWAADLKPNLDWLLEAVRPT